MPSIFSYQFFQNALGASLLTAVICGLVGAYIVVRRIVFVSGHQSHPLGCGSSRASSLLHREAEPKRGDP